MTVPVVAGARPERARRPRLPPVPDGSYRVHLLHSSRQFSDTDRQTRSDLVDVFGIGADVVTFTELDPRSTDIARDVADQTRDHAPHGYELFRFPDECGIAVRRMSYLSVHTVPHHRAVLPGVPKPPREGGRCPRGVSWVQLLARNGDPGDRVAVHVAHWPTGFGQSVERRDQHRQLTTALIDEVHKHGAGTRLAFFAGDLNLNHPLTGGTRDMFAAGDLVTIWDEIDDPPATHAGGATIDMIGHYARDRRVTLVGHRVWDLGHSDHRTIGAWYDVRLRR